MSYGTGGDEPKANREAEAGKSLQVRQHRKGDDCCGHGGDESASHEASGTGVSLIGSRREQNGGNSGPGDGLGAARPGGHDPEPSDGKDCNEGSPCTDQGGQPICYVQAKGAATQEGSNGLGD